MEDPRTEESQRVTAYKEVFTSEVGQRVWKDLVSKYLLQIGNSGAHAQANNPLGLAYIAGQRDLILAIQTWVECDLQARLETYYPEKGDDPDGPGQSDTFYGGAANIGEPDEFISHGGFVD